jgi:hypothetical protein
MGLCIVYLLAFFFKRGRKVFPIPPFKDKYFAPEGKKAYG